MTERVVIQRFHGEIKTQAIACVELVETEQDMYCCSHKRDAQGINLLRLQKDKKEKECYFIQWHLSLFCLFG